MPRTVVEDSVEGDQSRRLKRTRNRVPQQCVCVQIVEHGAVPFRGFVYGEVSVEELRR